MNAQLELDLEPAPIGGYDPDAVRPVMTMAEAAGETLARIFDEGGVDALLRVGVVYWGRGRTEYLPPDPVG